MHGELAEHAVHAPHGLRGLHGLRVLHVLHALHARAYSQVKALPGLERIKNPPRRSDIEAKVRPAESSLTAAIARSRHVAGPETNQEADSSQRDSRRDRSETPGMPTDSRPEIRGFDHSGMDNTHCSAVTSDHIQPVRTKPPFRGRRERTATSEAL